MASSSSDLKLAFHLQDSSADLGLSHLFNDPDQPMPSLDPLPLEIKEEKSPEPSTRGRTVTVYFCGTCSKRSDAIPDEKRYPKGELVSSLFRVTSGEEGIDKIIVDGIASGEEDVPNYWVNYGALSNPSLAAVRGSGFNRRVKHALVLLKNKPDKELSGEQKILHEKLKDLPPITKINIVGWSRGAAQAITLAYELGKDEETKNIPVNLVLLDPVPGPTGVDLYLKVKERYVRLLPNVKNCLAFYARNERSTGFEPVVPLYDENKTQFVPVLVPGAHNHLVGGITDHKGIPLEAKIADKISPVGDLTRAYAQHVLTYFGTKLNAEAVSPMPLKQSLRLYQQFTDEAASYSQMMNTSYTVNRNPTGSRMAMVNDRDWRCTELDTALKNIRYQKISNGNHLDFCHEKIEALIKVSDGFLSSFRQSLKSFLERNEKLSEVEVHVTMAELWQSLEDNPFLICAILEDFQAAFNEENLASFDHRRYDLNSLMKYVNELLKNIISAQNEEIEQAQVGTEEEHKARLVVEEARTRVKEQELRLNQAFDAARVREEQYRLAKKESEAAKKQKDSCYQKNKEAGLEALAFASEPLIEKRNSYLISDVSWGLLLSLPVAIATAYLGTTLLFTALAAALVVTSVVAGALIGNYYDDCEQTKELETARTQEALRVQTANSERDEKRHTAGSDYLHALSEYNQKQQTTLEAKSAFQTATLSHRRAELRLDFAKNNLARELARLDRMSIRYQEVKIEGQTKTYKKLIGFFEEKRVDAKPSPDGTQRACRDEAFDSVEQEHLSNPVQPV